MPRHVASPVGREVAGPASKLTLAEVVHDRLQVEVDVLLSGA